MKDKSLSTTQNLIAGGIAGAVGRTITAPIDVVKILFQIQVDPISGGTQGQYSSLGNAFKKILRDEGYRGFFKGNGVALMRIAPYTAVKFATFEHLKGLTPQSILDRPANDRRKHGWFLGIGGVAGIAAAVSTYPFDLVRTRLTVQKEGAAGAAGGKVYNGIVDCFRQVVRDEGPQALFKGLGPTIVGAVPYEGGTFMAYEAIKALWPGATQADAKSNPIVHLTAGCLAGAFAQTISYPFDTVRKRLQIQSQHPGMLQTNYKGMVDAFVQMYRQEGLVGLWKGNWPNLLKVAPFAAIQFAVFEQIVKVFRQRNAEKHQQADADAVQAPADELE